MSPTRPHTKWGFAVLFGVLGSLIVGVFVLAFLWPAATAEAKDLPVAISGPSAAVDQIKAAVATQSGGAIDFQRVSDRAAAVDAIRHRDVYGAIVIAQQPEVLTASAANTSVAQLLASAAAGMQAQLQTQSPSASVTVTDVVPLSADDPNGAGLTTLAFPLVLGGMIGGILISLLVVGVVRRLLALLVYGAAAGLLVAFVAQTWFAVLPGDFVVNAAALALAMLATASVIVGFTALLGTPGIALGAVITILIGNPIAGATMPYQFLAGPWGEIGQYFVPGAGSTLIRSLGYFPDADTGTQWLVLGAWAVGGLVLSVIGHYRSRAEIPLPAAELEAEAAAQPA